VGGNNQNVLFLKTINPSDLHVVLGNRDDMNVAAHLASVISGSVSESVGSERKRSSPEELMAADTLEKIRKKKR